MAEVGMLDAKVTEAPSELRRASELLRASKLKDVVDLLGAYRDDSGAADALLGAAYYRLEEYSLAARAFRSALDKGQTDPELRRLMETALANELADVKRHVPEPIFYDRDTLLKGPMPGERADEPRTAPAKPTPT